MARFEPFPEPPEPRLILLRRMHATHRENQQLRRMLAHTVAELNAARGAVNELLLILDGAGATRQPQVPQ
jgi:hypothetical protein